MPHFFIDEPVKDFFEIIGDDAKHIIKSLRMQINEPVVLCCNEMEYFCRIVEIRKDLVKVELLNVKKCESESKLKVRLFQSLPKGEKMDLIVQKAVELGVESIVPVITRRCVSRPNESSLQKKIIRWQKIAKEAAMQSERGYIPKIFNAMTFEDAVNFSQNLEKTILFYENGGELLSHLIDENLSSVAIFVGPEGGFEDSEVAFAKSHRTELCSLGKRIFRTETAAIVSVAATIYEFERGQT